MRIVQHIPAAVRPPCTYTLELNQSEFDMLKRVVNADAGLGLSTLSASIIRAETSHLCMHIRGAINAISSEGSE